MLRMLVRSGLGVSKLAPSISGVSKTQFQLRAGFSTAKPTDSDQITPQHPKSEPARPSSALFELGNEGRDDFLTTEEMYTYKEKNFIDYVRIHAYGGTGGIGCATYEDTRKGVRGRPSGGSGGAGGAVWIRADITEPDLGYLRTKHITGNPGRPGKGDSRNGANGKDVHISVPVGTSVFELKPVENPESLEKLRQKGLSTLANYKRQFIADLSTKGDEVRVAKGGAGGKGNMHDSMIKERLYGVDGEYKYLLLELKIIADVGFVGMPNAGKSTLLASLTRCKPKIAPYAFTTLSPNLGKLRFIDEKNITLADIPGLIEGSSKNKGLGFEFLRHVEKAKSICYVVDMSNNHEYKPWDQYLTLKHELAEYSPELVKKPEIIVGNKCDSKGAFLNYEEFKRKTDMSPIMVSAKQSEGLEDLVLALRKMIIT